MIQLARTIDVTRLAAWVESHVRQHLTPDVSSYARGRLRCWLGTEPALGPNHRPAGGLILPDAWTQRLHDIVGWPFDYCLVTYSGDRDAIGITPHRDAGFADAEAWSLNLTGECQFDYWSDRGAQATSSPTESLLLKPGMLTRFDCKHIHAATPSARRWAMNFWRAKPGR